jgi:hypothetical protein
MVAPAKNGLAGAEILSKRPQVTCLAKSTAETNTGRTHQKPRNKATPKGLRPKQAKPGSLAQSTEPACAMTGRANSRASSVAVSAGSGALSPIDGYQQKPRTQPR